MKKTILTTVAMAVALGFAVAATNTVAADKGPADMVLKTTKAKKPATFPHAKHQEFIKCDDCHKSATYPQDKKWDAKVGHGFCKDCHKKGYNGKKGPNKCNDCHKK